MHGSFDMAVVDPPFITREVWEKYTEACKILLKKDGKLLCSTIDENAGFMEEIFNNVGFENVKACVFRPSIPNLVYQYSFYTNYDDDQQGIHNPEINLE